MTDLPLEHYLHQGYTVQLREEDMRRTAALTAHVRFRRARGEDVVMLVAQATPPHIVILQRIDGAAIGPAG